MDTTKIDALLERHEILKLKWLQLWEQDLFNWVTLWEEMADCITELRSTYQEQKQANDTQKGKRMIELKAEKWNWQYVPINNYWPIPVSYTDKVLWQ